LKVDAGSFEFNLPLTYFPKYHGPKAIKKPKCRSISDQKEPELLKKSKADIEFKFNAAINTKEYV